VDSADAFAAFLAGKDRSAASGVSGIRDL